MNRSVKKSLYMCAAVLLLGSVVTPSISNPSVSARRRYRTARVHRRRRTRRIRKARKNRVSYRTYKYNLRKYNQYQRNLKRAKRSFNRYKKLLRHRHSKRLMRKYTNSKRYWQNQIKQLTKSSYRYQRVIKQYKHGNSFEFTINHPRKGTKRNRGRKTARKYKIDNEVPSTKPKAHKLAVHHYAGHHVKSGLADATHKYVLSTNDMVSSSSLKNIQNNGSYRYGGGSTGDLVQVVAQKQIDGRTFDYIKDPGGYDNNKWIYDGELSDNKNDTASNINLGDLENDIRSNYINDNAQTFLQQMKSKSLSFINNARESYGRNPVTEDPTMDQLANLRANQLISRYSHYTPDGQSYAEVDAPQFNISMNPGWGENIAFDNITPSGHEATDPTTYSELDGNGMAYAANNNMLNWDSHSNWGHKRNMLNPDSYLVGIGSAYDPNTQKFFLAEDFYNNPTIIPYNDTSNNSSGNSANNNDSGNNNQQINGNGNGINAGGNGTQNNGNGNNQTTPNNNSNDINDYGYATGNNNTIQSSSNGAVIDHGSNNTINANGSVIVDGYNNTVNAKGIVIANGYNNIVNSKKTIWNDTNTNDGNYSEALANGVAIDASNVNSQTISK